MVLVFGPATVKSEQGLTAEPGGSDRASQTLTFLPRSFVLLKLALSHRAPEPGAKLPA